MSSKSAKTSKKTSSRSAEAVGGKPTSKRMTVAQLAKNLKSIESRLKGADTRNRTAIKALEGVVDDIKKASKQGTTAQKSALTKGLSALEIRMETYLKRAAADARESVRSELASVTASGADLTTLQHAVESAHVRLDSLDQTQRDALARLNRHIADLATSVDRRLKDEAKAREESTAVLEAKIDSVSESFETRIEKVEQETAVALTAVGDKITEFAAVLEDRAKSSDAETADRLADLAQETKTDFNAAQSDITVRLEALEMIAASWSPEDQARSASPNPYLPANLDDPRIDKMGEVIESLQKELSRMHARMASVQPSQPTSQPSVLANVVPMPSTLHAVPENPYAPNGQVANASQTETPAPNIIADTTAAPINEAPRQKSRGFTKSDPKSHFPQEFDPAAFNVSPAGSPGFVLPAPIAPPPPVTPYPAPLIAPPPAPPLAPPMASSGAFDPAQTESSNEFHADEPLMPAPLPISTYADPAYAEGDEMRAERIGGEAVSRKSLSLPTISSRNIRVGALAVGVSVVGLLAAKTILGGNGGDIAQVRNDAPAVSAAPGKIQNTALGISPTNDTGANVPTPPLGQYSDNRAPNLDTANQDTLDQAVQAGNPIAQFQKGLVHLQAGQMEEGARLIRLSANRNQPAAQYRLAKLYESGTGVAKDPITARELIQRAAAGGNRVAMHDLGNYFAYGQGGLDRDIGAALDWFTKAAERGVVDSQFNVAFLREGNEGVPADLETALFWYYIAARQGDQGAPDRIEVLSGQVDAKTISDIKSRANRFNPKPVDEAANGIFRDVPWTKKSPGRKQASSAEITQIRDAQIFLGSLGYDVGTPDGIVGAKTRKAIKSFESVNGLPETGQITEELVRRLEIASGA